MGCKAEALVKSAMNHSVTNFDEYLMPPAHSVTPLLMDVTIAHAACAQKVCADSTQGDALAAALSDCIHHVLSLSVGATVCILQVVMKAAELMCSRCVNRKRCSHLWMRG